MATAVYSPRMKNSNQHQLGTSTNAKPAFSSSSYSQAVSRSDELLACARTALKLAKARYAKNHPDDNDNNHANRPWHFDLNPSDLTLHQQQQQDPLNERNVSMMNADQETIEDGLTLLRAMDAELMRLEQLVRRRGQTNDPTEEIAVSVQRLERDAEELTEIIRHMVPPSVGTGQRQRHFKAVQQWFQNVTQQKTMKLKDILQIRGQVLAEQARRRQRFVHGSATSSSLAITNANKTSTAAAANALFSMPPVPVVPPPATKPSPQSESTTLTPTATNTTITTSSSNGTSSLPQQATTLNSNGNTSQGIMNGSHSAPPTSTTTSNAFSTANMNHNKTISSPMSSQSTSHLRTASSTTSNATRYSNYGGYGSYGGVTGGYGGSASASAAAGGYYYNGSPGNAATYGGYAATVTGMRQRRGVGGSDATASGEAQQQQSFLLQQEQQQQRHTVRRLQEAKMAEKSLAELGTVFGKMSELISQQSETLEKIEDDVEAAFGDVSAGHGEISILYSIKKGNRALILKVFGLLIFFIVFMRFYVR